MSLYEVLSLLISSLGFGAIVVSLFFLRQQVTEATVQTAKVSASLKSSVYSGITEATLTVDRLFIDHPELRPYFYSEKLVSENDTDYHKVLAAAEYILDFFSAIVMQAKHFPEIWPRLEWEEYMVDMFARSPALCDYLKSVSNWYVGDSSDIMRLMNTGERRRFLAQERGLT
jgi:hypothetical protein